MEASKVMPVDQVDIYDDSIVVHYRGQQFALPVVKKGTLDRPFTIVDVQLAPGSLVQYSGVTRA